jgi:hypothetical protein
MRLSTNLLSRVVLPTALPTAHALQVPTPTPTVLAQRAAIEFKKLQHLLEESIAIETTFNQAIRHLQDTYGDVEVGNLYQGIEVSSRHRAPLQRAGFGGDQET